MPCFSWDPLGTLQNFAESEKKSSQRCVSNLISLPYIIFFKFGHAGASASGDTEKAKAKIAALAAAGAIVPRSFQELDQKIFAVYKLLVEDGVIVPRPEPVEPQTPMDFAGAQVIV